MQHIEKFGSSILGENFNIESILPHPTNLDVILVAPTQAYREYDRLRTWIRMKPDFYKDQYAQSFHSLLLLGEANRGLSKCCGTLQWFMIMEVDQAVIDANSTKYIQAIRKAYITSFLDRPHQSPFYLYSLINFERYQIAPENHQIPRYLDHWHFFPIHTWSHLTEFIPDRAMRQWNKEKLWNRLSSIMEINIQDPLKNYLSMMREINDKTPKLRRRSHKIRMELMKAFQIHSLFPDSRKRVVLPGLAAENYERVREFIKAKPGYEVDVYAHIYISLLRLGEAYSRGAGRGEEERFRVMLTTEPITAHSWMQIGQSIQLEYEKNIVEELPTLPLYLYTMINLTWYHSWHTSVNREQLPNYLLVEDVLEPDLYKYTAEFIPESVLQLWKTEKMIKMWKRIGGVLKMKRNEPLKQYLLMMRDAKNQIIEAELMKAFQIPSLFPDSRNHVVLPGLGVENYEAVREFIQAKPGYEDDVYAHRYVSLLRLGEAFRRGAGRGEESTFWVMMTSPPMTSRNLKQNWQMIQKEYDENILGDSPALPLYLYTLINLVWYASFKPSHRPQYLDHRAFLEPELWEYITEFVPQ
jgi:hypothetical protein